MCLLVSNGNSTRPHTELRQRASSGDLYDTGAADVGCACAQVATRFVVRVVEQLVEQVSVSIMDLDASISLVPKGAGPAGPPPSE